MLEVRDNPATSLKSIKQKILQRKYESAKSHSDYKSTLKSAGEAALIGYPSAFNYQGYTFRGQTIATKATGKFGEKYFGNLKPNYGIDDFQQAQQNLVNIKK